MPATICSSKSCAALAGGCSSGRVGRGQWHQQGEDQEVPPNVSQPPVHHRDLACTFHPAPLPPESAAIPEEEEGKAPSCENHCAQGAPVHALDIFLQDLRLPMFPEALLSRDAGASPPCSPPASGTQASPSSWGGLRVSTHACAGVRVCVPTPCSLRGSRFPASRRAAIWEAARPKGHLSAPGSCAAPERCLPSRMLVAQQGYFCPTWSIPVQNGGQPGAKISCHEAAPHGTPTSPVGWHGGRVPAPASVQTQLGQGWHGARQGCRSGEGSWEKPSWKLSLWIMLRGFLVLRGFLS